MSIERPGLEQIDPGAVADGTYVLTVAGGTITGLEPINTTTGLFPLTSKLPAGDAGLVFGGPDDDELILTEVPL